MVGRRKRGLLVFASTAVSDPFLKVEPSFRCLLDPPYYFVDSLQSHLNLCNPGSKLGTAMGDELSAFRNGMCHGEYGVRKSVLHNMKFE